MFSIKKKKDYGTNFPTAAYLRACVMFPWHTPAQTGNRRYAGTHSWQELWVAVTMWKGPGETALENWILVLQRQTDCWPAPVCLVSTSLGGETISTCRENISRFGLHIRWGEKNFPPLSFETVSPSVSPEAQNLAKPSSVTWGGGGWAESRVSALGTNLEGAPEWQPQGADATTAVACVCGACVEEAAAHIWEEVLITPSPISLPHPIAQGAEIINYAASEALHKVRTEPVLCYQITIPDCPTTIARPSS